MGTLNVILAKKNIAPVPVADARELVGAGARALLQRGLQRGRVSVSEAELEGLVADFIAHYQTRIADESVLFPDVESVLQELKHLGYAMTICTNKPAVLAQQLVEVLGLTPYFKAICGGDTFAVRKPDPAHFWGTVIQGGGQGETSPAIMIGDSRTDIETARAASVPVIAVTFGYSDVPVAQLNPDAIITTFRDLPKAMANLI